LAPDRLYGLIGWKVRVAALDLNAQEAPQAAVLAKALNLGRVSLVQVNPRNGWKPVLSTDRPNLEHRLEVVWGLIQGAEEDFHAFVEQKEKARTACRAELSAFIGSQLAGCTELVPVPVCCCREGRTRQFTARRAMTEPGHVRFAADFIPDRSTQTSTRSDNFGYQLLAPHYGAQEVRLFRPQDSIHLSRC
jgi:hypothetical protein